MKPSEVGNSYDRIAQRWYDDSFPRSNGIEQHVRALAFVKEHGHALDIGCGCSGRFVDLLRRLTQQWVFPCTTALLAYLHYWRS